MILILLNDKNLKSSDRNELIKSPPSNQNNVKNVLTFTFKSNDINLDILLLHKIFLHTFFYLPNEIDEY